MTLQTTDQMIPVRGVSGAVGKLRATGGITELQLEWVRDCYTTTNRLKAPYVWSSVNASALCERFRMGSFNSFPPWNLAHAHLLHSLQGSSPGLWTIQDIRARVPTYPKALQILQLYGRQQTLRVTLHGRQNVPSQKCVLKLPVQLACVQM